MLRRFVVVVVVVVSLLRISWSSFARSSSSSSPANDDPVCVTDGVAFETEVGGFVSGKGNFFRPVSSTGVGGCDTITTVSSSFFLSFATLAASCFFASLSPLRSILIGSFGDFVGGLGLASAVGFFVLVFFV